MEIRFSLKEVCAGSDLSPTKIFKFNFKMSMINRFPAASRGASSLLTLDPWMQQQLSLLHRPALFESMSSPLGLSAVDQFQVPAFDLRETAKEFLIHADVPGIKQY